mgnify:CR=1 FL=1
MPSPFTFDGSRPRLVQRMKHDNTDSTEQLASWGSRLMVLTYIW